MANHTLTLSTADLQLIADALSAVTTAGGRGATGHLAACLQDQFNLAYRDEVIHAMARSATLNYLGDDLFIELADAGRIAELD